MRILPTIKEKLQKDIHLKDLVKGSAITFVLKMSGMSLSYLLIYLISRQLGAEGVGFYNLMLQILTVLGTVLGLGMNIAVLRYVGQFNNEEQRPKMRDLYHHFVCIVAPLTVLVGILIYFGADYIVQWVGKDQEYADGLKMIGIVLPFFTINRISLEFIRGLKQLQISELLRSVLRPLAMIVGIYLLFWNHLTKMDVIFLLVVGLIINSIVSRWTIWKKLKNIPKQQLAFERKELLKTSYPMMVTGISSALLVAMPVFFLDYYSTQAEVGIYNVAFRLAGLVSLVLVVVNTIAAPKFAELFWAGKMDELQKVITQSTKMMFWLALALTIILIGGGDFLLGIFGKEFKQGYWVMVILTVGQLVNTATGSVGVFMNMSGRQGFVRNLIVKMTIVQTILILIVFNFSIENHLLLISLLISSILVLQNITLVIHLKNTTRIKTYYLPFGS